MTRQQVTIAAWLMCGLMAAMSSQAHALSSQAYTVPSPLQAERAQTVPGADARLAQAAPAQSTPQAAQPAAASGDPIGTVATLTGSATVTRNGATTRLKLKEDIFQNDVVQTSANSTLGITFHDATTFNLTANARITVDNFVYEDGGANNAALFNVARGTVAFVASAVAKTGDMKIATPTATLGIRGTTGLVEVPEGAASAGQNNVAIKLYPDADGKVGHIEVNGRDGTRLGFLTQGATGFAIRPGVGGARFAAVPLAISPLEAARDRGIVRQLHAAQTLGRRIVTQRRNAIRNNPALRNNPAAPKPNVLPKPPGQPARPDQPGQPARPGLQKQGSPLLQPPPGQFQPTAPRRPVAAPRQRPPKYPLR
jgi:hypothetical protein